MTTKKHTYLIEEFKELRGIVSDADLGLMIKNRKGNHPDRGAIQRARKKGMLIRENSLGECFIIEPYYERAFL
ncbi:MAG: hypothetical protein ACN2B6_12475 [Rickettsiales bacterium]